MAPEDKFDRLQQLVDEDKEKGYFAFEDMGDAMPADLGNGAGLDGLLGSLDAAGIELLEEPKAEFDQKLTDGDELLDLDLGPSAGDKVNDPVRTYSARRWAPWRADARRGEIEIARRIERGQTTVMKTLSRTPLVIQEVSNLAEEVRRGAVAARDVVLVADPLILDEAGGRRAARNFWPWPKSRPAFSRRFQQVRQKLIAVPRGLKPKLHRHLLWETHRARVRVSQRIRTVRYQSQTLRLFTAQIRAAVEELTPVEREIAAACSAASKPRPRAAKA